MSPFKRDDVMKNLAFFSLNRSDPPSKSKILGIETDTLPVTPTSVAFEVVSSE